LLSGHRVLQPIVPSDVACDRAVVFNPAKISKFELSVQVNFVVIASCQKDSGVVALKPNPDTFSQRYSRKEDRFGYGDYRI
jgi:hypothetical protein